jgi:large subunit ribosomal protein L17
MRHKISGRKLGRQSGHRRALFRNLVTDLIKHEKIVTTEAKAKEIQAIAEKVITLGKKSGLHSYRQTLSFVMDKQVTEKVFADLAKRYSERPGGYTRIIKLEPRLGDGAPMAKIELVD